MTLVVEPSLPPAPAVTSLLRALLKETIQMAQKALGEQPTPDRRLQHCLALLWSALDSLESLDDKQ